MSGAQGKSGGVQGEEKAGSPSTCSETKTKVWACPTFREVSRNETSDLLILISLTNALRLQGLLEDSSLWIITVYLLSGQGRTSCFGSKTRRPLEKNQGSWCLNAQVQLDEVH